MAVYRFKVLMEDYEDVVRVIEIRSNQSFEELHNVILESVGFDKAQLASFYMSDDQWKKHEEITLMPMEEDPDKRLPIMKDVKLGESINDPHQKMVYVYDFLQMWTFFLELTGIFLQEDPKKKYPLVIKTEGIAPKQHGNSRLPVVEDDEFDFIKNNLIAGAEGETDEGFGEEGEEGEKDESDEFGDEFNQFGHDED